MVEKYMPTDIFEVATTSTAQLHLLRMRPLEDIAQSMWEGYQSSFIDDGVSSDIVRAATLGIAWLQMANAPALPDFLQNFKWYCACFGPDGHYVRKRFFDGLLFHKAAPQNPQRVEQYVDKLRRYFEGLVSHQKQYPPAPEGWNIGKRGMWNEEVEQLTDF